MEDKLSLEAFMNDEVHMVELEDDTIGLFIGIKGVKIHEPREFIKMLRESLPDLLLQVVDARFVAGQKHLELIIKQSFEAWKRGITYTDRRDMDLIVRLACDLQIKDALEKIGIKSGVMDVALIGIGKRDSIDRFYNLAKRIGNVSDEPLELTENKAQFIKEVYHISDDLIRATVGGADKLALLLAERAALLLAIGD
ncbi:MAG: KEOPS complex subunit Cgi121 [Nitrososphaerota archaeon]|nr:KEOPS complex subunit Cgi121 [Nitrososphaerales archaeon]MDW8045199.1 KEOPS complex subunit Cgi121 [Nitrososphaerota archaeon]